MLNQYLHRCACLLAVALLFSACTHQQTRGGQDQPVRTAPGMRVGPAHASQLQRWQLQGRVSTGQFGTGKLVWHQQQEWFDIKVTGPLGIGGLIARGTESNTEIVVGGETMQTQNPEALFKQHMGWHFPLRRLRWWARGLPASAGEARAKTVYDPQKRLARLEQDGWLVQYQQYARYGQLWLPTRFVMTNGDVRINVLIDQWANLS